MKRISPTKLLAMILLLVNLPGLMAQQASPAQASSSGGTKSVDVQETVQQAFQREQQALARDMDRTSGLDSAQLEAWRTRNAVRLSAQQERAKLIAAESSLVPLPEQPLEPNVPADASPVLKEFLTTRSRLVRSQAQIHNELLDALPQEVTEAQVEEMRAKEMALFLQRNGKDLKAQTQRAKAMSEESAWKPLPAPPPLSFPPEATPEMKAFLTARHQLMSEQIEVWNRNPEPATRDPAMREWMKQNTSHLQQVSDLAVKSSNNSTKKAPR